MATESYEEQRISHPFKFRERVVIFENVPALVCSQCGEYLLRAQTAKRIDKLGRGKQSPAKVAEIGVYDLADLR